jgi:hypothetical protein
LCGKLELLSFGEEGFIDFSGFHIGISILHTVNSVVRFIGFDLSGFGYRDSFNSIKTRVISQSIGDIFKGIREGSDSVLFNIWDLVSFGFDGNRAGNF